VKHKWSGWYVGVFNAPTKVCFRCSTTCAKPNWNGGKKSALCLARRASRKTRGKQ